MYPPHRRGAVVMKQFASTPQMRQAIDDAIWAICREERADRDPVSIRHLFYRVAALGLVPKTDAAVRDKEWKRPGFWTPSGSDWVERQVKALRDRETNPLPYAWIVDTTRERTSTGGGDASLADAVDDAINYGYSRNHWLTQPNYVELWVGKQSMDGVLARTAGRRSVGITNTHGFGSISQYVEAAHEIERVAKGRPVTILWVDDCDPSAELAFEKVMERLERHAPTVDFTPVKIAVTREMRDDPALALDTRPTKDSTHGKAADFGESVEVDAMPPDLLRAMVDDAIEALIDHEAWNASVEVEEREQARWRQAIEGVRDTLTAEGWIG